MNKNYFARPFLFLFLGLSLSIAQSSPQPKDNLILWGDGWRFSVKEPIKWHGNTEKSKDFHANIIFYQISTGLDTASPLIRIRVNSKVDDNTQEDLNYDIEGYKKEMPNVQFKDIKISHKNYRCFPKLFYVPNKFYEYVVYLNPGKNIPWTLSISMNKQNAEASGAELSAYKEIIASIYWLANNK